MKKISRAKLKKGWQVYNAIMSNFWLLIAFCLAGVIIGYFVDKSNPTENNTWWILISIIFFSIGIFNFFIHLIADILKLNKTETKEIKDMVKENPNVFNNLDEEEAKDDLEQDRLNMIEEESNREN